MVSALACARLLLSVVNFAKGRLATRVGVALTFDLRAKLVEKLHSLGLDYYDRHQVGSLTSRVAYDSEVIQSLLQQITGGFLLQIVQVTAVGVMLFTLNPKLAVYTLIPAPLVIAGSWFFWKRVHPRHYRYWDSSSKQAGMLTGMLSGIRVVKAFAQEDREYARFNRISDYLRQCRMRVDYSTAAFSAIDAAHLQPGRADRVVRRRARRAGRQDDARLADGVPGVPGDVLHAAGHALAIHHLAHELSHRLPARVRAARHARRDDRPGQSGGAAAGRLCRKWSHGRTSGFEAIVDVSATSGTSRCCGTSTSRSSRARRSASSAAAAAARRRS